MSEPPDLDGRGWIAAMKRGDFSAAWTISDAVLASNITHGHDWSAPRHVQWIWDGQPLCGRVLVRCYHGLGDTLQFARFLPLLSDAIVWAQPTLIPLLRAMRGSFDVLPLHDGTPEIAYDVDIEIMELAHALRVTLPTLPTSVPYFNVPPAPRLSRSFSVGVVAEAGGWNAHRSVPPDLLEPIRRLSTLELFSLQLAPLDGMHDICTDDVLELAQRLSALDLVISVDTMVAHLAGALGVPTWTLLPAEADWRWMEHRTDSPWYPTMRLFRQPAPGAWAPVIDRVVAELSRLSR